MIVSQRRYYSMSEKVIKVFFDQSGLPYKDRELSVHYPLVGLGF